MRGRALAHDFAFFEHDHAVAHRGQVVHAMRHHDNCRALLVQLGDELQEFAARHGVESRHGLVEHERFGVHGKHAGESDAALLAARKLEGAHLAQVVDGKSHAGKRLVHACFHFIARKAQVAWAERHIVEHGVREQLALGVLEHDADARLRGCCGLLVGQIFAAYEHAATARLKQAIHMLEKGRFARPCVARNAQELAAAQLE